MRTEQQNALDQIKGRINEGFEQLRKHVAQVSTATSPEALETVATLTGGRVTQLRNDWERFLISSAGLLEA